MAVVLPHRVSFKSGSQKPDRIPGVVLFLLISWSVDTGHHQHVRTLPWYFQPPAVLTTSGKICKNVETYTIPIVPRHSLLSDGITRVFPTFIRVGHFQHPCWGPPVLHSPDSLTANCTSTRNNCHFGCCQSDLIAPAGSGIISKLSILLLVPTSSASNKRSDGVGAVVQWLHI